MAHSTRFYWRSELFRFDFLRSAHDYLCADARGGARTAARDDLVSSGRRKAETRRLAH